MISLFKNRHFVSGLTNAVSVLASSFIVSRVISSALDIIFSNEIPENLENRGISPEKREAFSAAYLQNPNQNIILLAKRHGILPESSQVNEVSSVAAALKVLAQDPDDL